jgi:hypothetical protein
LILTPVTTIFGYFRNETIARQAKMKKITIKETKMQKSDIFLGFLIIAVLLLANSSNIFAQSHEVGLHDPSIAGYTSNATETGLKIYQNSKNIVKFEISKANFVKIGIYDNNNNVVRTYLYNNLTAGTYEINLTSGNLSKGVYTCVLSSGSDQESSKLVIE